MNIAAQSEAPGDDVVAAYLANRLSEADAQAFEIYCLNHAEFAQHVEREIALKTGLRQARTVAPIGASSAKRPIHRWSLALAASIVVIVGAAWVYQYAASKASKLVAFASVSDLPEQLRRATVSQVRLVHVRGVDSAAQVSVPIDGVVNVRLLPDVAAESGTYTVQMSSQAPSSVGPLTIHGLKPAADGFLEIFVPAAPLIGRTWLVSVGDNAIGKGQRTEVYRVQVVAELE